MRFFVRIEEFKFLIIKKLILQTCEKNGASANLKHCLFGLKITRRGVCLWKENGGRGIAPTQHCTHILKHVLTLFVCIKLNFFITIFHSLSYLFPGAWI